jgi:O-acetyl-ADP-ribose deacetylase (regulator of RNase III)
MKIRLIRGDITEAEADVIVNAANSGLMGGGGVDGAIHRAGGPAILEECKRIRAERGTCPTGQVVFTGAGRLRAKHVAHAVGPVWSGGGAGEAALLRSCYVEALEGAERLGSRSIAFPCISTGVYGYPKRLAAEVVAGALRDFSHKARSLEEIILVSFDMESYEIYRELFHEEDSG